MNWDILILSGAAVAAIMVLRNRLRPQENWVEIQYYEWVRAVKRGERTLTTRSTDSGPTRYWLLEA